MKGWIVNQKAIIELCMFAKQNLMAKSKITFQCYLQHAIASIQSPHMYIYALAIEKIAADPENKTFCPVFY